MSSCTELAQPTGAPNHADAVQRLVRYFENLSPQSVAQLDSIYAPDARFKDPFNDVKGVPAIQAIFAHMFVTLTNPRFVVTKHVLQGEDCFLTWEFRFAFNSHQPDTEQVILGATHIVFSPQGLVCLHRDYWDAAQELYEKLPLVGALMRWLKKRVNS
jgi:steroid Delta-isomerase